MKSNRNMDTDSLIFPTQEWVDDLRDRLFEHAPNSGCLSPEEAQFARIAHFGEWSAEIAQLYYTEAFLKAREDYQRYITYTYLKNIVA